MILPYACTRTKSFLSKIPLTKFDYFSLLANTFLNDSSASTMPTVFILFHYHFYISLQVVTLSISTNDMYLLYLYNIGLANVIRFYKSINIFFLLCFSYIKKPRCFMISHIQISEIFKINCK